MLRQGARVLAIIVLFLVFLLGNSGYMREVDIRVNVLRMGITCEYPCHL